MNESYSSNDDSDLDAAKRLYFALSTLPKHDNSGPAALFSCVHKILDTKDLIDLQSTIKRRFPSDNPLVATALNSIEGELALRTLL